MVPKGYTFGTGTPPKWLDLAYLERVRNVGCSDKTLLTSAVTSEAMRNSQNGWNPKAPSPTLAQSMLMKVGGWRLQRGEPYPLAQRGTNAQPVPAPGRTSNDSKKNGAAPPGRIGKAPRQTVATRLGVGSLGCLDDGGDSRNFGVSTLLSNAGLISAKLITLWRRALGIVILP
jgi:hypothetical protein